MDTMTTAAGAFFRLCRTFSEKAKPWDTDVIWYETKPDEKYDLTLISSRVYGRRCEHLAVMAALGLDNCWQAVPQKRIALPNESRLAAMKRRSGFESIDELRDANGGAPIWLEV